MLLAYSRSVGWPDRCFLDVGFATARDLLSWVGCRAASLTTLPWVSGGSLIGV